VPKTTPMQCYFNVNQFSLYAMLDQSIMLEFRLSLVGHVININVRLYAPDQIRMIVYQKNEKVMLRFLNGD
jgi:hypothetical protein